MSHEVELERPARVEQRERVVLQKPKQQPPSQGPGDVDGGVVLEKEEQCVCQICTCGKHRCRSASSDFSANHIQDALQQRACAGCEKEAGRRQWEVSPDTVRQISKSYRSIERQDDASETTTVSEQRLSRQERASDSKVCHAQAVANGTAILGDEIGGQNRQRAAHAVESGKAALSGDAMASHVVQTSEFAAHDSEEHMKSEANCHRHSDSWQADGGRAEGRVSSRYRPKTSLRLEGPHEYTTTSSEYFSTVDHNLVSRAEQYRSERQATSESRHYPLTRPQTSLRTGGKTHYSTTTAEDFKLHDQAEKVTRHLRPRRFDDPSYDTAHVDDEGDVKKRRTEADHSVEDHVTAADDFQDRTEGIVAQGDSYGGQLRSGELVSSEAQTYEQSYLEANHQHRETSRVGETREEFEMLQSQVMESSHLTDHPLGAMASDAYFQPEVSAPFYPKDNLALSTGEMDLRTTNEMEYYKKKMDRVRPVKPKSLAKLFGSNGSSSEGDLYAVPSHRNEKPSRLQKGRVEQTHAAGLASTCDDLKMHLGANNVLIKHKAKGQRKAHFEDDSFKWDGPVSYSTTTNESYKKPESSRGRVALCRRPQSHDVFHRFTQTGDELRKIKGKKQDTDEITMFGRKDSAELIAEIQGLLGAKDSGRSENKAAKQNASVRKKAALEKTSKRERSQQAIEAGNWQGFQQEAQERPRGQQKGKSVRKDATHKARFAGQVLNGERVTFQEKRNAEIPVEQHESRMRDVVEISTGQQEYLESSATTRKYEAMHQKRVQAKNDVHRSEEVIVEGNEAQGYFDQGAVSSEAHRLVKPSAERPLVSRVENSHLSGADQNKFHFSTTTADSFKNVGEKIQPPKPFYPKPNLAPEGGMSFETVHHGEFTPKTVVEVPTPVRPVSTLKLSDDTSYLVRNEDKIGYSKAPPVIGETRFSVRKPESTLVLGHDSVEYKTTSQTEYKAHELREMEDIYKSVKVKRDRQKTYTRGQPAGAASAVPGVLQQRQRSSSGIGNMTTTTRAAYKPISVERPQPYRPQSCLKVRSNEDSYAEISTTMRDTFRRVTPTARVKPIKREASLKKLGDDTDYVPRKTTTSEAYREVKIQPKPEPYRPVDNLKVTGGMTFSTTTQESYVSRSSLQHHASEFVERAKPIKRDAVAKDIIFPVDSSDALAQGAADYAFTRGAEESTEVLRSLENTGAYARISKAPRERPRTHQKVGRGAFEHTTTSMAEYQDPRTRSWKQRSTATGRLVRTASAECPAAFLNTDKSEYVFKEVIGDHRFYLPAVQ